MSALTDLFTAMANKIRSKTGTATTYTPLEMVSDGIDDVYAAGYDAGGGGATGIPITPSNASPVSLTSGESYEMLANGYAIASYNNLSPSNVSPAAIANNTIYKAGGTGYAIDSYSSVTPSNSSPASLSNGNIYKMGGGGYAIESYQSKTPTQPGTAFNSGMVKMSAAGYAYTDQAEQVNPTPGGVEFTYGLKIMNSNGFAFSTLPTGGFAETTLWTNSSPTSSLATTQITLSQSIANFDYIAIKYKTYTTSSDTIAAIFSKADVRKCTGTSNNFRMTLGGFYSTGYTRTVKYDTDTAFTIGDAWKYGTSTSSKGNNYTIPTSIVGLKFTP